jgi:polyhydroxyalkanoate synthesis regulator phasin
MDTPESPREKRPLAESFERLWSQALLAVSTAEEEAGRVVQRVTGAAGWSQDEVRRHARELTERLVTQRRDLERNVEEGVRRALGRMTLPRREELQDVSARLERIAQRIEALEDPS